MISLARTLAGGLARRWGAGTSIVRRHFGAATPSSPWAGTVMIVSPLCPFPEVHGNSRRLVSLIKWLKRQKVRVVFVLEPLHVEDVAGIETLRSLIDELLVVPRWTPTEWAVVSARTTWWAIAKGTARLGKALRPAVPAVGTRRADPPPLVYRDMDERCWPATVRRVRELVTRHRPAAVICEYALLSKCLENLPEPTLKIIDTVEVFSRNHEQFERVGVDPEFVTTKESESRALRRADVLIAIQRNEAEALRELAPSARVITVGYSTGPGRPRDAALARGTVLYVGSANRFNQHGLEQFLVHGWPAIREAFPQAVFRVVGKFPAAEGPSRPGVVFLGRISDEQLAAEYQRAHVVINPQMAGTGLKIKGVEALVAGCPLVMNPAGADGIEEGAGGAFLVADDWAHFAKLVVAVLSDDAFRLRLERAARVFAERRLTVDATFQELGDLLTPLLARPPVAPR